MKTLIKKLKTGVLLTGLVILTSCGSNLTMLSVEGINAIHSTIPSLAISATKYTGNKIAKYLKNSSTVKNSKELSDKKAEKPNGNLNVLPISIGATEGARLVSSPGR